MSTRIKKERREITQTNGTSPVGGSVFQASFHRASILPPPHELERYEALYPGTTKIILDSFKLQVEHRTALEDVVIKGDSRRADRGQIMAFIIVMTVMIFGFVLLLLGKNVMGLSLLLGGLATLLGAFLWGSHSRKKERVEKLKK